MGVHEEFAGVIGRDWRDSTPWWPPEREPRQSGAPERAAHRARRRRLRAARLLRLRHRDPQHRRARGVGASGSPNFHTTALCSPTRSCLLTGPQPPLATAWAASPTSRWATPGYCGRDPARERLPVRDPARRGLRDLRGRQVAPHARRRNAHGRRPQPAGRSAGASTAGTGSTAARRTSSCRRSTATTTRCSRRAPSTRATTSPRTSPTTRSSTSSDLRNVDAEQPFFLYFATGACHSPHHAPPEWIERYRGQFDDGWDALRERVLARQIASGSPARRAPSCRRARRGCRRGTNSNPRTRRSRRGSWSALPPSSRTPTRRSVGCLDFLDETGDARQHDRDRSCSDNGASAEGGPTRLDQRRAARQPRSRRAARSCVRASTSSAGRRCTTTTRGAGPWPATRRSSGGSARCTRAASPIRASCAGRRGSRATPGRSAASSRTRSTCCPTVLELVGVEAPDEIGGVGADARSTARASRTSSRRRRRRARSGTPRSTSRCSAHARIYHDGLEGRDVQAARADAATGRTLRCVRSTTTCGSCTTSPRIRRRSHDLADDEPERLARDGRPLVGGGRALPRAPARQPHPVHDPQPAPEPRACSATRYLYLPTARRCPRVVAVNVRNRSHAITADGRRPRGRHARGVLLAIGCVLGGWSLHVLDGRCATCTTSTASSSTSIAVRRRHRRGLATRSGSASSRRPTTAARRVAGRRRGRRHRAIPQFTPTALQQHRRAG